MSGKRGDLNAYTCERCGESVVTVDRDEGVTPMMIRCRATAGCAGYARSHWYRGVTGDPSFEWRRPTRREYRQLSAEMRAHVDAGGLCLYAIAASEAGR